MSTLTDRYYQDSDVQGAWREVSHTFQVDMVEAIIDHRLDGLHCELALVDFALDAIKVEKKINYRKREAARVHLSRVPLTLADGLETPLEWYLREVKPFKYTVWKEAQV